MVQLLRNSSFIELNSNHFIAYDVKIGVLFIRTLEQMCSGCDLVTGTIALMKIDFVPISN